MQSLDALADPVRLAVTRYLAAHPSASAGEVAAGAGVHLNTARAHLGALHDAGVVERVSASEGQRGRPVVRYRLIDGWAPAGEMLLPLSELLAAAVLKLDADPGEIRDLGFEWGRRWAGDSSPQPIENQLAAALARLGFGARVSEHRLMLSDCPCPLVAPKRPGLVCALADAVTDGVLEGSALGAGRRSHDPGTRRCSATLKGDSL
jgi:predicted ArsR family transcriptional regulator